MEKQLRTHRVGSITAGLSMIIFGALFILHLFIGNLDYSLIFKCWPFMIIGLGLELLISNFKTDQLVYDKAAVAMMILTAILATGMAGADMLMEYMEAGLIH
ncbi:hypothetical protein D6855_07350 [Butyrivibrio sp. CB08]|uniref:hypothetical protein n=1 Tax=Butyrivibrio sp. CB08 TaxID=2364879 RepID=UPI000EA898C4|nr:hypothetical protein [Butyrivibrio sp. CB08]RKM60517.1 hypothetical protein D6855_07350 [Butyrivibrio sp. CB08]